MTGGWQILRDGAPALNGGRREVVFIDTSVAEWQALAEGIPPGLEVILLDGTRDGLSGMADWARTRTGYDAVHVLSHGTEGIVRLGTLSLDSAAAGLRTADLATLGAALTATGDLLLYGCNVGSGTGEAFLSLLAQATGADVTASDDLTGASASGGDWLLEAGSGAIESAAIAGLVTTRYAGLLDLSNTAPTLDTGKSPALTAQSARVTGAPTGAAGTLVSDLVAIGGAGVANVTDPDDGATTGMAITATDTTNGTWWFSTDGGANWTDIQTVGDSSALLLAADANTRLYFQNADSSHSGTETLTFRAWDGTSGTAGTKVDPGSGGGATAFSSDTDTADVTLLANQSPVNSVVPAITGTTTVGSQLSVGSGTWSDPDGDTLTYSYQWYRADDSSGTNVTAISGATASTYTLAGADAHKHVRAVVTADDGHGSSTQTAATAYGAVTNLAPTDISLSNGTVSTFDSAGATVGTLSATDGDDSSFTYSLVSGTGSTDNGLFTVSGTAVTANNPGTLTPGSYSIRVQASDGHGGTYAEALTVTASRSLTVSTNSDSGDDATTGGTYAQELADGGGLSLREALALASAGNATIAFAAGLSGQTITLGSGVTVADGIVLDADAAGTLTIAGSSLTLSGAATLGSGSGDTLTVSSVLAGSGSLTKSGAGTLTLSGSSTYSGTTAISAGTLKVAGDSNLGSGGLTLAGGTLATTGGTTIDNALTLTADSTVSTDGDLTLSGAVAGGFKLTKAGSAVLTLGSSANTFSGGLAVSAGSVAAAGTGNLGSGAIALGADTRLILTAGTGTQAIANAIEFGGGALLDVENSGLAVTLTGARSGSGELTKTGDGTLTLGSSSSSQHSHSGAVTVIRGTLRTAGGWAIGDSAAVTLNDGSGAILELSADETIGSLTAGSDTSVALGSNTLTLGGGASTTIAAVVSGTGGLSRTGSGTTTLSGVNTYTGVTSISGGTLSVSGSGTAGSGSAVTIASGATLDLSGVTSGLTLGSLAGAGGVTLGNKSLSMGGDSTSTTFSGVISGSGSITKTGTGTLTLSGSNTYTGTTTVSAGGTLSIASDGNLGSGTLELGSSYLSITGATTIDNAISLTSTGTINTGADATLSGVISGSGGLTKAGSSTLTLSATNTYTGQTVVSAGTLALTGQVAGNVALGSATLAGTGTVLGNLIMLNPAAELRPGIAGANNGVGTLTVNGDLTFSGRFYADLASTTSYDSVAVGGTVSLGSGATVSAMNRVNGHVLADDHYYRLIDNQGASAISGMLEGNRPEGYAFTSGTDTYIVSYAGGTGNDLTFRADRVAPTMTATTPQHGTIGHPEGTNIVLTFSEAVKASTGNFLIKDYGTGTTVRSIAVTDSSQVTISGSTVTINPAADLGSLLHYYVETGSGIVLTDNSGNGFAGISGSTTLDFTTADTTRPTLVSASPADNGTGVAIDANLVLTFSETVHAGTGSITIRNAATNDAVGSMAVIDTSQVTFSGSTLTINPAADLDYSTHYYLQIGNAAVLDQADNAYQGIRNSTTLDFTTAAAPPPPPASPPPPPPPPTVTQTVDGVTVQQQTTTNSDGSTTRTTTIPVVTETRQEQTGNNSVADIPLVTEGGTTVLSAQVPTGVGLTVSGGSASKTAGTSLTDLIREIEAHTDAGSSDRTNLTGGGSGFLSGLDSSTPLLVQTLVPTVAASTTAPTEPLVISAPPPAAGQAQTALVIDVRNLPSGTIIQLQNVSFAAVIGAVQVTGGEGSQSVFGDGFAQFIVLGADDDTLHGGDGADTVGSKTGDDVIYGDGGDDNVFGGDDNDRVFGGIGADTVQGNKGADFLQGNQGDDTVWAGQGNDTARGGKEADQVHGDLGDDVVYGDYGSDQVYGNAGNDTLWGGDGNDIALDTADTLFGGQGNDIVYAQYGADSVSGDLGDDYVEGNRANDSLSGGDGADTLRGGRDDDLLQGGAGADELWGDLGADTMTGGAGADVFVFRGGDGADTVTDFSLGDGDRLRLAAGMTWTAADGGGGALVSLSGGGSVRLVGVAAADVTAALFAS